MCIYISQGYMHKSARNWAHVSAFYTTEALPPASDIPTVSVLLSSWWKHIRQVTSGILIFTFLFLLSQDVGPLTWLLLAYLPDSALTAPSRSREPCLYQASFFKLTFINYIDEDKWRLTGLSIIYNNIYDLLIICHVLDVLYIFSNSIKQLRDSEKVWRKGAFSVRSWRMSRSEGRWGVEWGQADVAEGRVSH